jgi:hypothetical protein
VGEPEGEEDEGASPGRRAVLMIFGGVILVFVVAGYLAVHYRAETRERLRPQHPTAPASSS